MVASSGAIRMRASHACRRREGSFRNLPIPPRPPEIGCSKTETVTVDGEGRFLTVIPACPQSQPGTDVFPKNHLLRQGSLRIGAILPDQLLRFWRSREIHRLHSSKSKSGEVRSQKRRPSIPEVEKGTCLLVFGGVLKVGTLFLFRSMKGGQFRSQKPEQNGKKELFGELISERIL